MKKIFMLVFGCDRRKLDGQRLHNYFSANNHIIVNEPEEADYIIFLACGFTNVSAKEGFDLIKKFQKYDAELIVAGCLPAIQPEQLSNIFNGRIITTKDLNQNPDKIDKLIPGNKIKFRDIPDTNVHFQNYTYGYEPIYGAENKNPLEKIKKVIRSAYLDNFSIIPSIVTVGNLFPKIRRHITKNLIGEKSFVSNYLSDNKIYHLRVTWGCTGNCSYCGIKKAVGPIESKSLDVCINEFKKGLEMGYKDFLINSDDAGPYGLENGLTFPYLLDKITEIKGDYEITISGLNPVWVVKYVDDFERIVKSGKIKEIIFTLQSGSSRILKLMNRYNDVEKIKDAYKRLKNSYPDLGLFLQMIIGFPTETEEDFQKSLSFIKEFEFNIVNLFPFSCLEGTKAENIEPKIPQDIIFKRLEYTKKLLKKEGYNSIFMHGLVFYKK